jgi:hypothetical protein
VRCEVTEGDTFRKKMAKKSSNTAAEKKRYGKGYAHRLRPELVVVPLLASSHITTHPNRKNENIHRHLDFKKKKKVGSLFISRDAIPAGYAATAS